MRPRPTGILKAVLRSRLKAIALQLIVTIGRVRVWLCWTALGLRGGQALAAFGKFEAFGA